MGHMLPKGHIIVLNSSMSCSSALLRDIDLDLEDFALMSYNYL
jgi:hypothetical protein